MTDAQEALLSAAKRALSAMCKAISPDNEFTDSVDALDKAITAFEAADEQAGYEAMERRERAWMDEIDKRET
jgi:hypothetical protein